ncbi:hypothetical protein [Steroidobacter agaridevorans]|uniref:hypothetical protein n=1 Tax=Steroidobacter agaridevorans TaxID=2695856 RepID=UPI001323D227|nr:hypothetical protein [Steroidobacter agaridevorans]GFE87698.1 hypothetical protein GCM10011488_26520 [Steroidobacter agaridevorans]
MRIAVALNGVAKHVAGVSGAGYLNAHLNLANRPKEHQVKRVLRVVGYDTNRPTETVFLDWPEIPLAAGDTLQLQVLDEGPADSPASRRTSTELPTNLFSDPGLAKELLALCEDFQGRLFQLMKKSETVEPADEHERFKRAIGNVVAEVGESFLRPVYRRHPDLVPDALRGERL